MGKCIVVYSVYFTPQGGEDDSEFYFVSDHIDKSVAERVASFKGGWVSKNYNTKNPNQLIILETNDDLINELLTIIQKLVTPK